MHERPPGDLGHPVRSDRSGEDDGDGPRCEDEVEEVIQPTSATGGSAKSILFLSERNEDKENKDGHVQCVKQTSRVSCPPVVEGVIEGVAVQRPPEAL